MMRRKERALVIMQRASAIAAVAVFVLWVASVWWYVSWSPTPGYTFRVRPGGISVTFIDPSNGFYLPREFTVHRPGYIDPKYDLPLRWWFDGTGTSTLWSVHVPLWAFEVPSLTLAAALWRRNTAAARRVKAGQCVACGYDRSGLAPEHPCPECGAATSNR